MTTPIAKGSRFLVLAGTYRGQVASVGDGPDHLGQWSVTFEEGAPRLLRGDYLAGSAFKRLADAPAEVDPLVVEIDRR